MEQRVSRSGETSSEDWKSVTSMCRTPEEGWKEGRKEERTKSVSHGGPSLQAQHLGLRHEDHEFKIAHPQEAMMPQNRERKKERKCGKER